MMAVGILARLDTLDRSQRLEVEDRDVVGASVAGGITAIQPGRECDAVNALGVGDFPDDFAGVEIGDNDLG